MASLVGRSRQRAFLGPRAGPGEVRSKRVVDLLPKVEDVTPMMALRREFYIDFRMLPDCPIFRISDGYSNRYLAHSVTNLVDAIMPVTELFHTMTVS